MERAPFIECTRRLEFDAGHRLRGHESKCRHLHGHRYVVEATFVAKELDEIGRTIDFGVVKEMLGSWIDENWDHGLLLHEDDKELGDVICDMLPYQRIYYLPCNPTAENIARYLLDVVCVNLFLDEDCECTRVTVYETPNCSAVAQR